MAFLMANTSNVKEMKNGRPMSVKAQKDLPNCAIVALETAEDHVYTATANAADSAIGLFVIVAPEINVQQYRRIDNDIAKFGLEADEVYTAYELGKYDRLEFSVDYFASEPTVGQTVKVAADGKLTGQEGDGCLKVVAVREQRLPMTVKPDGTLLPASVKMIKVEVVK